VDVYGSLTITKTLDDYNALPIANIFMQP